MNEHDLAESLATFLSGFGIILCSVLFLVWIVTLVKSFVKERKFFAKNPSIANNGRPKTIAGRIALIELEIETLEKKLKNVESYASGLSKINLDAVQKGDEILGKAIDNVETTLNLVRDEVQTLAMKANAVQSRVEIAENRVTSFTQSLHNLNEKINSLTQTVVAHDSFLYKVEKIELKNRAKPKTKKKRKTKK